MGSRGDFEWSAKEQGQILGSLFYGNIISQIPAGILAEVMGGKHIFGFGVLISSIVTLLTPLLVYQGTWCFILSRAIIGFAQVIFLGYLDLKNSQILWFRVQVLR